MRMGRWLPLAFFFLLAANSPEEGVQKVLPLDEAAPVPGVQGKPVSVPQDVQDAAGPWSVDAQIAKLAALHPQQPEKFSFAVIGDAEPGRFAWERVFSPGKDVFRRLLSQAQAAGPDFIVQLGDEVSQGTADNYRKLFALLSEAVRVPYLPVMGNHDRSAPNGPADKTLYKGTFGKTDYWVDYGGWRFVGLDSSDRRVTSAQLKWLKTALSGPKPKMLFTHVPPAYLKGKLKSSCEVSEEALPDNEDYLRDVLTAFFPDEGGEFEKLVSEGNVRAVFMGHIHAYAEATHGGVRYILSGGGGSPLYPLPPAMPYCRFAHYFEVGVSGESATFAVRRLSPSAK